DPIGGEPQRREPAGVSRRRRVGRRISKSLLPALGAKIVMRSASVIFSLVLLAFLAGFASHVLYRRWNPITQESQARVETRQNPPAAGAESPTFRVNFGPFAPSEADTLGAELTAIVARDVDKVRALTGQQVRIRGRVFRVGYSAKS